MTGNPAAPRRYDCVVLGGGPAGAATALTLVDRGARVLIVEKSGYSAARLGETLPPAIAEPLHRLRLREAFEATGPLPGFGMRSVWGSGEPRDRSHVFDPNGKGWHVDRRRLDAALATTAEARGATLRRRQRCVSAHQVAGGWSLVLADGDALGEVLTDVVVDATGRPASFSRPRSDGRIIHDRLVAVATCLTGPHLRSGVAGPAMIEAVADGWWYSTPVPGDRLVLAFMTDADLHPRAALSDEGHWTRQLERAVWTHRRVVGLTPLRPPRAVLANTARLVRCHGPGWLAVGDAAAAYDPLSGDGVLRALSGGIAAARAILGGDAAAMRAYGDEVADGFARYCRTHIAYSRREARWTLAPFWQRRQNRPSLAAGDLASRSRPA